MCKLAFSRDCSVALLAVVLSLRQSHHGLGRSAFRIHSVHMSICSAS